MMFKIKHLISKKRKNIKTLTLFLVCIALKQAEDDTYCVVKMTEQ